MRRLVELFYPPYLYQSKVGPILPNAVKLKLLSMVVLNSIQTVSSNFPVPSQGGGQNNIERLCSG